jgi:predicted permease
MAAPRGPVRWLHLLGLGRPEPEESVRLEVEHHLSEMTDRLVAEGRSPEEARREAERRFGDARRYRPRMTRAERRLMTRERWSRGAASTRQILVSTARTARRSPIFAGGVVLTLGLGLGANATMYGIVDRLLLRPPEHIVEPDRVRRIFVIRPALFTGETRPWPSLAYPDYADLKAGMSVAAFTSSGERTVGSGEGARRAKSALASAELFPVLGVQPRLGRFFTAEESSIGASLTAVLSEEYWRSAYGADPTIVGRSIEIDGRSVPVVGVAPAGFTGVDLMPVDIWLPLEAAYSIGSADCITGRNCYFMEAVARLADGVSIEAAEAEATRHHRNGRSEQIEQGSYSAEAAVMLAPLIAAAGPDPSAESRVAAWLAGVSLIVLLIACANVANLLLARGTTRQRETVVRLALGAGRGRLVGHAVAESMVLALTGGVLALAIARWGGSLVRSTLLPGIAFPDSGVGAQVAAYTLVASLAAGLLAGAGPALAAGRTDLRSGADPAHAHTGGRSRVRGLLTVTQAALSVVLLVGAGLFVRSLAELRGLDLGFDTDRLLVADFEFASSGGMADADIRNEVHGDAMARLAALPEVESVAGTATSLTASYAISLRVPERDSIPRLPGGGPYIFSVTPGYFETAGLEITSGRAFDQRDGPDAEPVAVVSETMARVIWPDENPLGRCLLIGRGAETCSTVVGVVEDAARNGYQDEPYMAYYVSDPAGTSDRGSPKPSSLRTVSTSAPAAPPRTRSPPWRPRCAHSRPTSAGPACKPCRSYSTPAPAPGRSAPPCSPSSACSRSCSRRSASTVCSPSTSPSAPASSASARRSEPRGRGSWHPCCTAAAGSPCSAWRRAWPSPTWPRPPCRTSSSRSLPAIRACSRSVALALLAVSLVASLAPGLRATRVDPVAALKTD